MRRLSGHLQFVSSDRGYGVAWNGLRYRSLHAGIYFPGKLSERDRSKRVCAERHRDRANRNPAMIYIVESTVNNIASSVVSFRQGGMILDGQRW
jgi:hypothetical protein